MKLKELRKINKKTQQEIADILNVTQQTYAKYELGLNEPTIASFCKLADYYAVSLDYLVGRQFAYEFGYMDDDEKLLVNTYRKLNHYNQAKLIGEANGMLLTQD